VTRRLRYDVPGPDWRRSHSQIVASGIEGAFAPELMPPLSLVVEIGFCRGEFMMEMARRHPKRAFLGVEVSFKRVLKMARRLALTDVENIRLLEADGEGVVQTLLGDASVEEFWINFPDPWPKARHANRRIVQPRFVSQMASRLVDGGVVQVATDDRRYAEEIDQVLSLEPLLRNTHPSPWLPEVSGRLETSYEAAWRAEGRPLHFFAYERRPRQAPSSPARSG
jgi:tRNA (guanine-N7-)-methyltransferase